MQQKIPRSAFLESRRSIEPSKHKQWMVMAAFKGVQLLFFTLREPSCAHSHTNSHKHTQTPHTTTHKHPQAHTKTHKHTQTHTNTHKHTQTHTNTHKHTQTHSNCPRQKNRFLENILQRSFFKNVIKNEVRPLLSSWQCRR